MYDQLSQHVERVDLAHPKELKAISAAAVKADHIDTKVLANLARMDFLPTAMQLQKTFVTYECISGIEINWCECAHKSRTAPMRSWPATILHLR